MIINSAKSVVLDLQVVVVLAVAAGIVIELVVGLGEKPPDPVDVFVPLVAENVPKNGEAHQQGEDSDGDPLNESFPGLDPAIVENKDPYK